MTQVPAGDWQIWAERWPAILDGPNRTLYTTDKPRTSGEINHRIAFVESLWPLICDKSGKSIELGAGRATTSQYLAPHGWQITLADLVPEALQVAAADMTKIHGVEPECLCVDAANTGQSGGTFDLCVSYGLLEHFLDPVPVIRETARLLKRGGLAWHIIVEAAEGQEETNGHGTRTRHGAEPYQRWAAECLADARCERGWSDNVLILTGRGK